MAITPPITFDRESMQDAIRVAFEPIIRQMKLHAIAAEGLQEVEKARAKHGEQRGLPDGTGPDLLIPQIQGRIEAVPVTLHEWALQCKYRTDKHAAEGNVTRLDILLEEVAEASAEDDLSKLREELVQVIAMGIAWIYDIDQR